MSPRFVLSTLCRKSSSLAGVDRLTLHRYRSKRDRPAPILTLSLHLQTTPARMLKPVQELPRSGYAVVVDGQVKTEFKTKEGAQNGARDLKRRFPMLQITVYDAETKHTQHIEGLKSSR